MIYKALIPAAMCVALACPAMATTTSQTGMSSGANGSGSSAATAPGNATPRISRKLRQNLKSAGYTNIHIVPESFMIHAKDKQGNPVMMVMTPNSMTEVVAVNNNAGASGNQQANAGGMGGAGASQSSGMNRTTKQ